MPSPRNLPQHFKSAWERAAKDGVARRLLGLTGLLCLAGTLGPAVGDLGLQRIGVFGYAVVLPVAAWQTRRVFRVAR